MKSRTNKQNAAETAREQVGKYLKTCYLKQLTKIEYLIREYFLYYHHAIKTFKFINFPLRTYQ